MGKFNNSKDEWEIFDRLTTKFEGLSSEHHAVVYFAIPFSISGMNIEKITDKSLNQSFIYSFIYIIYFIVIYSQSVSNPDQSLRKLLLLLLLTNIFTG